MTAPCGAVSSENESWVLDELPGSQADETVADITYLIPGL